MAAAPGDPADSTAQVGMLPVGRVPPCGGPTMLRTAGRCAGSAGTHFTRPVFKRKQI